MKNLLNIIVLIVVNSCVFNGQRGRYTYRNTWSIAPNTALEITSNTKESIPVIIYNDSPNAKIKFSYGANDLKEINAKDSLPLSENQKVSLKQNASAPILPEKKSGGR